MILKYLVNGRVEEIRSLVFFRQDEGRSVDLEECCKRKGSGLIIFQYIERIIMFLNVFLCFLFERMMFVCCDRKVVYGGG